jgi:hypothetical protein
MRSTYRVLAYLIAALVAVQAAAMALGFFRIIHLVEDGGAFTAGYDFEENLGLMIHRYVGMGLIPLLSIALLVVAFFTGISGAVARAGAVFGLIVLQIALVFVAFVVEWGGALHGLNAIALFVASVWAARLQPRIRDVREQPAATAAV